MQIIVKGCNYCPGSTLNAWSSQGKVYREYSCNFTEKVIIRRIDGKEEKVSNCPLETETVTIIKQGVREHADL